MTALERAIQVDISSRFPIFINANADSFGALFASMNNGEQVEVLRAMVKHMRPHQLQWDYIAIELEKDENREVRDDLRSVLFPVE